MAEFLIMSPKADCIQPLFGDLFTDEPLPKNGYIEVKQRQQKKTLISVLIFVEEGGDLPF